MKRSFLVLARILVSLALALGWYLAPLDHAQAQSRLSVDQTTLEEPRQLAPEISTEEMKKILASGSEPVFDVRTEKEYAIAHIPGTINLWEKEVEQITKLHPDKTTHMVLYCNGLY